MRDRRYVGVSCRNAIRRHPGRCNDHPGTHRHPVRRSSIDCRAERGRDSERSRGDECDLAWLLAPRPRLGGAGRIGRVPGHEDETAGFIHGTRAMVLPPGILPNFTAGYEKTYNLGGLSVVAVRATRTVEETITLLYHESFHAFQKTWARSSPDVDYGSIQGLDRPTRQASRWSGACSVTRSDRTNRSHRSRIRLWRCGPPYVAGECGLCAGRASGRAR